MSMMKRSSGVLVSKRDNGRVRVQFVPDPAESMTKQQFKDQCDVNRVVEKYLKTGMLPELSRRDPRYGDFSEAVEFREAQDLVVRARESFEALPAAVRRECGNDPSVFLEMVRDEEFLVRHKLALPASAQKPEAGGAASAAPAGGVRGAAPGSSSAEGGSKPSGKEA